MMTLLNNCSKKPVRRGLLTCLINMPSRILLTITSGVRDEYCLCCCLYRGIAHTYIAREKLIKGCESAGATISKSKLRKPLVLRMKLTAEDIDAADVVILAIDVKIKGEERFKNKRIVRVKTEVVIKSPIQFIEKVEKSLANA